MNEHPAVFNSPMAVALLARLKTSTAAMQDHRVFTLVNSVAKLRLFMSWHAFAVWDFMSLVKRLQIELTSVHLPWVPPRSALAARLINEIVLGEETDLAPCGRYSSHHELYLDGMEEIGADTGQVRAFTELISAHMPLPDALRAVQAPRPVHDFVLSTMEVATRGSVEHVLGSFVFGRECAIPDMFRSLLKSWRVDERRVPTLIFYLNRHIHLDGDAHGPAAMRMIAEQVGSNAARLHDVLNAGLDAIGQRVRLWDALAHRLDSQDSHSVGIADTHHAARQT